MEVLLSLRSFEEFWGSPIFVGLTLGLQCVNNIWSTPKKEGPEEAVSVKAKDPFLDPKP